jgi:hypothetical protein
LRLAKGPLNVYQSGKTLMLDIKGRPSIDIIKNYRLAHMYFCTDNRASEKDTIDKITFIKHVNAFNDKGQMPGLKLYDSARSHINIANFKISFLKPEIGLELKLLKNLSFYNAIGLNFYGAALRDARTFINEDGISQLRIYINQQKRIRKGKSIYNFSGVYIAPTFRYLFENAVPDKQ